MADIMETAAGGAAVPLADAEQVNLALKELMNENVLVEDIDAVLRETFTRDCFFDGVEKVEGTDKKKINGISATLFVKITKT